MASRLLLRPLLVLVLLCLATPSLAFASSALAPARALASCEFAAAERQGAGLLRLRGGHEGAGCCGSTAVAEHAVEEIATLAALDQALQGAGGALVVVDFTAKWCGPCQRIAPEYEKMAGEFPATKFLKVDVDANQEAASKCGILAMPTFQLFLKGEKIAQVEGADPAKLREIIAKHSPA
eukprot:CAMPEP_0180130288 /NCGR_PEP_ID=MMETSP0986-20121125/7789_1 /TAXON_ID=697907 /ORGANISM="non described non described, Strain CCMP2293" /LENGTH=179 /DNA_ID=CAMNT_0022070053 /DNA_START=40 /DNA_END=579 /DNA_ORIENTATION=+